LSLVAIFFLGIAKTVEIEFNKGFFYMCLSLKELILDWGSFNFGFGNSEYLRHIQCKENREGKLIAEKLAHLT